MVDPPAVVLKEDRAIAWLNQGAQPSDAVKRIFDRDGIYDKMRSPQEDPTAEEPVAVEEQAE
jgi:ribosomal protein S16